MNNRVVDLNYFVYENLDIEWTILSFRTHVSDTIEEMAAEGIEEQQIRQRHRRRMFQTAERQVRQKTAYQRMMHL